MLTELPFLFFGIPYFHLEVIIDHFLFRMVCLDFSCSKYDFQIAFVFLARIYCHCTVLSIYIPEFYGPVYSLSF